jgi:hypothetical protein
MPMISSGFRVLALYPDGSSKINTLYAVPLVGKVIAHGWVVTSVAPRDDEVDGKPLSFEITVERPASEAA